MWSEKERLSRPNTGIKNVFILGQAASCKSVTREIFAFFSDGWSDGKESARNAGELDLFPGLGILNKHTNKSFFLPKYITMVFDVPIIFSFTDKFEEFRSPSA